MKSYRYKFGGSIQDLEMTEVEVPRPGPHQVLVRMRAVSLNFRDILVLTGKYPRSQQNTIIPISDGAGEIVELGQNVSSCSVGDRVVPLFFQTWFRGDMLPADAHSALGGSIDGVAAEFRVFDADGILKFAPHLSFEEAATLPCAALTAWNGLHGPRPVCAGETVLTLGTGGVSLFAMQFARAAGARVIVTSSSNEKLERARVLGADKIVNYLETPQWDEVMRNFTGGRGVDHVIETGGGGTMLRSIKSTRRGGWIHVIGLIAPGTIDPVHILLSGVTLRGTEVGSREMLEAMNRSMTQSSIKPVIDKVFKFADLAKALDYLQAGKHLGKIVVSVE